MNQADMLKRWPLFEISLEGISNSYREEKWFYLKTNQGMIMLHEEKKQLSNEEISRLDLQHSSFIKVKELRKQYPHIYISLNESKKEATCWLNVKERDREGLSTFKYNTDQDLHIFLSTWNNNAEDAFKAPNLFFICSCCKQTCVMDEDTSKNIDRLLDEKHRVLKFRDAGAGWYCSYCVENNADVRTEFTLAQKMGSRYYD